MKNILKVMLFVVGLGIILAGLQHVFVVSDFRSFHAIEGFYEEEKGALDAVYIGASNVYPFFEAPLAWENHGIAVYPFSVANMKPYAVKYVIEEARKTQPDALYIISLNNFKDAAVSTKSMHYLTDFMRFSGTKLKLVREMEKHENVDKAELLEFIFPFVRFHSGWDDLDKIHFVRSTNGLKSGAYYPYFLKYTREVSKSFRQTEARESLPEDLNAMLNDLLDYCDREDVNVLFVFALQMIKDESIIAQFNTIEDLVIERGYPVLNAMELMEEIGINPRQDYYNEKHMNVHGAIKMTDYLARYLVENFGFEDKRGRSGYESWDESIELYEKTIAPYSFDFERDLRPRDLSMRMPASMISDKTEDGWTISWSAVEGADGYYIYRRHGTKDVELPWQQIGYTDQLTYTDGDIESRYMYAYSVVPVRKDGDVEYYGECHLIGIGDTNRIHPSESDYMVMELKESGGGL